MTTQTTQTTNPSARDYAAAYLSAKTAKAKAEIVSAVVERAKASARKRWGNLAKAMQAGDNARVTAYAASGDAKRDAWKAVRAAAPAPTLAFTAAKPKAATKAKAKAPAKAKPAAKAPAQPALDANTLVAQLAGMDDAAFAAFFNALVAARAK